MSRLVGGKNGRTNSGTGRASLAVFHVTDVFAPGIGGIETALGTLLPRLRGVDSYVLTNAVEGLPRYQRVSPSTEVFRIAPSSGIGMAVERVFQGREPSMRLVATLAAQAELRRQLRRRTIVRRQGIQGIIHYHGLGWLRRYHASPERTARSLRRFLFGQYFGVLESCGVALYTDHSLFSGDYRRFIDNGGPSFVQAVRAVVAVEHSGYLNARRYIEEADCDTRVEHIANPVDLDLFAWREPGVQPVLNVGYVGRLEKPGLELVERFWRGAPDSARLTLFLASGSLTGSRATDQIRNLLRRQNVVVRWNTPYDSMPGCLASMDVMLDPYETGTPRTTIESLSVGRPVIRFRKRREDCESMLPEQLAPFVPSSDPVGAWQLIDGFRESQGRFASLCRACRSFSESEFDVNNIVEKYEKLYRGIA